MISKGYFTCAPSMLLMVRLLYNASFAIIEPKLFINRSTLYGENNYGDTYNHRFSK